MYVCVRTTHTYIYIFLDCQFLDGRRSRSPLAYKYIYVYVYYIGGGKSFFCIPRARRISLFGCPPSSPPRVVSPPGLFDLLIRRSSCHVNGTVSLKIDIDIEPLVAVGIYYVHAEMPRARRKLRAEEARTRAVRLEARAFPRRRIRETDSPGRERRRRAHARVRTAVTR